MYSPKIDENLIPVLYRLAKEQKRPMTALVNELIGKALKEITDGRGNKDSFQGISHHPGFAVSAGRQQDTS